MKQSVFTAVLLPHNRLMHSSVIMTCSGAKQLKMNYLKYIHRHRFEEIYRRQHQNPEE
jgi:hypothetical protein